MPDMPRRFDQTQLGLSLADHARIAGVDEAGRGPLAGPVVAAAVILDPATIPDGVADSKRLSEKRREAVAEALRAGPHVIGLGLASVAEIDELNILHASMLAMRRAVAALAEAPSHVVVDGNRCPELEVPVEAVVGGDATVAEISAASIIAKVERDRLMVALDTEYPGYGFAIHKGYPTAAHLEALSALGPSISHRRSFGPVRRLLEAAS